MSIQSTLPVNLAMIYILCPLISMPLSKYPINKYKNYKKRDAIICSYCLIYRKYHVSCASQYRGNSITKYMTIWCNTYFT